MGELEKRNDRDLEIYEKLLFEREQIKKDGENYLITYKKNFGFYTTSIFKIKLDCIKCKKIIAYYQAALNKDGQVNVQMMEDTIAEEMKIYYETLGKLINEEHAYDALQTASVFEIKRSKTIYHRIAKLIHPDLHPELSVEPIISDLWCEVSFAYRGTDTKRLAELEVQVRKVLKDIGNNIKSDIEIPNIKEKIIELKEEIARLKSEPPYTYKIYADDPGAWFEQCQKFEAEKTELQKQLNDLNDTIARMKSQGGLTFIWIRN